MKGGARATSGPAPDPSALRRDRPSDVAGWESLPAAGREGPAPEWPLEHPSGRELGLWVQEWCRPQAIVWERNGQQVEVAMYVRSLVDAESLKATVASRTLVRQQQEALGLSIPGLLRNRWRIEAESSKTGQRAATERQSARDRLRLVDGEAAS